MPITAVITGDRQAEARFERPPAEVQAKLRPIVDDFTARLHAAVVGAEPVRTGKLRGETASRVEERKDRIVGRVFVSARGVEAAKAGALEYGAHRATTVKAHSEQLAHIFARFVAPFAVMVGAHSRRLNIEEHAFLRGPLAEIGPQFIAAVEEAVNAGIDA